LLEQKVWDTPVLLTGRLAGKPVHLKRFLHCCIVQIQIFLLFVGIILLAFGIVQGDASKILKKARLVCMECIGIG
jgi:hypothetical protein